MSRLGSKFKGACIIEEVTETEGEASDSIMEVDSEPARSQETEDQARKRLNRGSKVASGNLAVLETNKAPVLRTADRKDILQFQQKRKNYIRVHTDSHLDPLRMRSLVSMIEPVFLATICQYSLGISFIEATDHQLEEWMQSVLRDDKSRDVCVN